MQESAKKTFLSLLVALVGCGDDNGAVRVEGTEPGDCTDGADNDGDGDFDCNDSSCAMSPLCQGQGVGTGDSTGVGGPESDGEEGAVSDTGSDTGSDEGLDEGSESSSSSTTGSGEAGCTPLDRELERTLTLEDEFDAESLDTSVWNTSLEELWGGPIIINNELQYYHPRALTLSEGSLQITADHTLPGDNFTGLADGNVVDLNYTSGLIASFNKFTQQYGYYEARMRLPRGSAMWSAFWLLPKLYAEGNTEIDVIEVLGHEPNRQYFSYHYHNGAGELVSNGENFDSFDVSEGVHTYAVDWRPDVIIWLVDGVEQRRLVDMNVPRQEMFIIANLAIGGWTGAPLVPGRDTVFPTEMEVEVIRAYAYPDSLHDERAVSVSSGTIDKDEVQAGETIAFETELLPRFDEPGMRAHILLFPAVGGDGSPTHVEQFDVDATMCEPLAVSSTFTIPADLAPGEYFMSVGLFSGDYRRTILFESGLDTVEVQ